MNTKIFPQKIQTADQGFALLEVLVSLAIISVAFLSIAGMQISAQRAMQENYLRSIAIVQLDSMLDRLRANHSLFARNKELQNWNIVSARLLPQSKGEYFCENEICTVRLQWKNHTLSLTAHL